MSGSALSCSCFIRWDSNGRKGFIVVSTSAWFVPLVDPKPVP